MQCYLHWRMITPLLNSNYVIYSLCFVWVSCLIIDIQDCIYKIIVCTDGEFMLMCPYLFGLLIVLYVIVWVCFTCDMHLCWYYVMIAIFMSVFMSWYYTYKYCSIHKQLGINLSDRSGNRRWEPRMKDHQITSQKYTVAKSYTILTIRI